MVRRGVESGLALITIGSVLVVTWSADQVLFEEPAPSPLYQATLDKAYSRFKESDITVPRGRHRDDEVTGLEQFQAEAVGVTPEKENALDTKEYRDAMDLSAAGNHDDAIEVLRKLSRRTDVTDRESVQHRIGDELRAAGRWKESIQTYRGILRKNPNRICCFEHIGDIYAEKGRADMAERMYCNTEAGYERLMRLSPGESRPFRVSLVKFCVDHRRRIDDALELAESLVSEQPRDAEGLVLLARCLEQKDRLDEAIVALGKAQQLRSPWKDALESYRLALEGRLQSEPSPR